MYKRILISYDGFECNKEELLSHFDVRQFANPELFLLAVMPPPRYIALEGGRDEGFKEQVEKQRAEATLTLENGVCRLRESNQLVHGKFVVGDSIEEITKWARDINADLIVVGHRYLQGWAARWWRGLAHRSLVEQAHCDVLVVILHGQR